MTEKLKNLMDEVTGMVDQDFAAPDLDAIVRNGDRSVRRRRILAGSAALGVVAAMTAGAVLLTDRDGDDRAGFANDAFTTDVPMWTVGSTLHTPDHTWDLGVDVLAVARTTAGIAYVGDDSGVYVFSGGTPDRVGTAAVNDGPSLVADADGTKVGWVEGTKGDRSFVVHDLATGEDDRFAAEPDPSRGEPWNLSLFLSIDGSTAYWLDGRGTTRTDLDTGTTRVVGDADAPTLVISAQDGWTVRWIEDDSGGDLGTDVADADGRVVLGHEDAGSVGGLSPGARWAASLDEALVWDLTTREQVALDVEADGGDSIAYHVLDADTGRVLSEDGAEAESVRLSRCELPAGTCTEITQVEITGGPVALPSFGLFPTLQFTSASSSASEPEVEVSEATSSERPE